MLLTVVENMIPARFGKSFRSPGVNPSVRNAWGVFPHTPSAPAHHDEEPT
ncbi:hypothetical protein QFZ56_007167 [Streptomyces achromogenes]|uniref:Uncharacterized protein n=1 Tax=Streptomyces achromogenes TaxID=67255 RepID=A0ABU0QC21_STRAH|nr:hypothetical protein [Streptomyces achromogenes]